MKQFEQLTISHSFADLGTAFYTFLEPIGLQQPQLLHVNTELAYRLGLDASQLNSDYFLKLMSGHAQLPQSKSLAAVYSGHQFGHWAGQLGDGRAHLLGAIETATGPMELQLKGSGLTPYSRMGDGRAVVRSSVREYLASHAMKALGIPTTEALALVIGSDPVYRATIEKAAIVCRVAPSFVRFGSFEHWMHRPQQLKQLLHYVVSHFYPQCGVPALTPDAELVQKLLAEVTQRSARMVAHWQTVGFCHGVLNTDNMSILGLSLDYGPYAFIDGFKIDYICNTTDSGGRYAWHQQPSIVHWNLVRLASCFLDICTQDQLHEALSTYESSYMQQYRQNMQMKLGWDQWLKTDDELVNEWWQLLHAHQADFSLSFRFLASALTQPEDWLALFNHSELAQQWLERYKQRSQQNHHSAAQRLEQMQAHNPLYVLRNHLAQQAIQAAELGDGLPLARLFDALSHPFTPKAGDEDLAAAPTADQYIPALSCSS